MDSNKIKLTTGKLKECAKAGLEYAINNLIDQYETTYNVKVNGITLGERGVEVDWVETASGIRTKEEVLEVRQQRVDAMVKNITGLMAGYEQ